MKNKPIRDVMTRSVHSVGLNMPVTKARELMKEHRVRHLPVMDGGKLVGILSDRDLALATSIGAPEKTTCEDLMSQEVYSVSPDTALTVIANEMSRKRMGCAVVQDPASHKVVGIFTTTDALDLLAKILSNS